LNNTTFGTTKFKQADFSNPGLFTTFKQKVTDLGVTWTALKKLQSLST
jgi:iron complex outermembrane receptor protein